MLATSISLRCFRVLRVLTGVIGYAAAVWSFPSGVTLCQAAEPNGEQVFAAKCAACHGAKGEGTKKYEQRLEGDRTVAQLTHVIAETMPEDDPGTLSAAESAALAKYVHEAIYSPIARERNRAARIDLARLTVKQYRHALADLVAGFRDEPRLGEPGLKAEYFKSRRNRREDRVMERTDPQVNFDFGTAGPDEKIEGHEFSIQWQGTVFPTETGTFDFIVRTEHSAKLWVNDLEQPLIDAWVKSGNDTEYRGSIYLVAGRSYPLRLEYVKSKLGVDDSDKQKKKGPPPEVKSSIALLWKRPHRIEEPIPAGNLRTGSAAEVFACSTPFPPDDRSYGWERGTTVSKEWDSAATDGAIETAGYITAHLDKLANTSADAPDRIEKLKEFCRRFAERAFRRPLSDQERELLIDGQFAAITTEISSEDLKANADAAVKRVVLLVCKSPWFLYREIGSPPPSYAAAARLSFAMWDSLPDEQLRQAAAAEQLQTSEQIANQTRRMLADPRAQTKLRDFLLTWLKAEQVADLTKDEKLYPEFNADAANDLRNSLELTLREFATGEQADFRELFLSDQVFLNGRLAKLYGVDLPGDASFAKHALDKDRRGGIVTHPYLLASFAHRHDTSPIHRGVFLARGVLGVSLRPPPEAVIPLPPEVHPDLTTRERVALQTKENVCMTCHGIINPLGFTLEHFDAIGRIRDNENGKPIDTAGSYLTREGKTVTVNNAVELGKFLAESPETHAAFVEQMFHFLVQQPVLAYGAETEAELLAEFQKSGYQIHKLAEAIAVKAALLPKVVEKQVSQVDEAKQTKEK